MNSMIINEKTWAFVRQHGNDDVRKVALQGAKDADVDLQTALQQIAGRQTARRKLPSWAEVDGIIYPPHLNMEQCSSEQTARYKAQIAGEGDSFADLTGGFGVDFYWMSQGFSRRQYVEQNEALCAIAGQNFRLLAHDCGVRCCDAETFLAEMEPADVVFLDPARRDAHGGRTYGIEDCTPNVLDLLPLLMMKAKRVVLKLSPMLDWRKAVSDIEMKSGEVQEVHIVSVDNECKELLITVESGKDEKERKTKVVCVNLLHDHSREVFAFEIPSSLPPSPSFTFSPSYTFLYEPNASIMKAGCFAELKARFPVRQIAPNSHLFLSEKFIESLPGRKFQILAVSSVNQKEVDKKFNELVDQELTSMKSANIAVRNFPLTADQLRKKLKLKDGGDIYLFATTLADGQHRLFFCRKIG